MADFCQNVVCGKLIPDSFLGPERFQVKVSQTDSIFVIKILGQVVVKVGGHDFGIVNRRDSCESELKIFILDAA